MQVRGRQFSNWWLFLLLPLFVAIAPFLLILLLVGSSLAGAILGPPAIWNRPWHTPSPKDLVGQYVESERHGGPAWPYPIAQLEFHQDGTMIVRDLPLQSGTETCLLSGSGTWKGPGVWQKVDLIVNSTKAGSTCGTGYYSILELAGHSKPYNLYWAFGDADSGTGVWLKGN